MTDGARELVPMRWGLVRVGGRNHSRTFLIVNGKEHASPSVLEPEALLREGAGRKSCPLSTVQRVRVLDPNGGAASQAHRRQPHS